MPFFLFLLPYLILHAKVTAIYLSMSGSPITSINVQWHTDQPDNTFAFKMSDHNWETKVGECLVTESDLVYQITLDNLIPHVEYSFCPGDYPIIYQFHTTLDLDKPFWLDRSSKPNPFFARHLVEDRIASRGANLFAENDFFSFPLYPTSIRESCEKTRAAFQRIYSPDLPPGPLPEQAQTAGSGGKEKQTLHADQGTYYGGVGVQDPFDLFHKQAVSLVAQVIQSFPHPKDFSLYAVLHGIALLRLKMAIDTKVGDTVPFGMWRSQGSVSSCNPYQYITTFTKTPLLKDGKYLRYRNLVKSMLPPDIEVIETKETLDGSELQLSNLREEQIEHTSATYTIKIIDHLEGKTRKILAQGPEQPRSVLLKDLAFVHWWLAQLTPFFRGSASCTEILIQAIMVAKGLSPPRLAGIPSDTPENGLLFGDLEAICMPLEQFINQYESMIDRLSEKSIAKSPLSMFK